MEKAGDDLEHRRKAMRELGRALALDPDNRGAAETLVRLLEAPPSEVPAGVRQASERGYEDRMRAIGRFATFTYAGMLGFLPVVLYVGVRRWAPFVGFFLGCALASLLSWLVSRTGSHRLALVPLALSAFGCAATAGIYGALIVAPQAVVINVLLYFFVLSPRYLPHAMAIGLSAIVGPIALELMDVTATYRPVEGGIVIVEQGLSIGHTSMLLFGGDGRLRLDRGGRGGSLLSLSSRSLRAAALPPRLASAADGGVGRRLRSW